MACITTFRGEGGNCNTGGGKGNFGDYSFAGYWVPQSATVCGKTFTCPAQNGVLHPDYTQWAFYGPTLQIIYSGCAVDPNQPYDCVNGGCVPKTTYNTPGKYANLATCQSGCAKDSNCAGECVSAGEIAALAQVANQLQSKLCG